MALRSFRVALCVAPLTLAACTAHSDLMQPIAPSASPVPAADTSVVTFVRHDGAAGILYTIMDEQKNFVGQIGVSSRFTATYSPGEHVFVVWNDAEPPVGASFGLIGAAVSAASGELPHVEPLQGTLAPGKAYVIEVGARGDWHVVSASDAALANTALYAPDAPRGQAFFGQSADRIEGIRKKALDQLHGYAQAETAAHRLRAEDGN